MISLDTASNRGIKMPDACCLFKSRAVGFDQPWSLIGRRNRLLRLPAAGDNRQTQSEPSKGPTSIG